MTTVMQLPMFEPTSEWQPPNSGELPQWPTHGRVGIDIETCDPQLKELGPGVRRGGYIVGVSFSIEDGPTMYLPIRHAGGGNLPEDQVWRYLKCQAESFRGVIAGANLGYDLDYLEERGVKFHPTFFRDVQVAEPLIDELQDSYSLENIALRHGLPGKDEAQLREAAKAWNVDPKFGLWQLPARHVGRYAELDAELPLKLLRRQERIIDEQELWGVYDLESRVLPVTLAMRRRGVAIDFKKLEEVERWSELEEGQQLDEVYKLVGVRIKVGDVWKPEALAKALERAGVEVPKTEKTNKPSIDKDLLKGINHPVARAIERARKVNKLRTTFAASIREYAVRGRIHCTFNQLRKQKEDGDEVGAAYGRMSCADPNLQQQPARDEFAKLWRSIYVPDEGCLWASCDYSQQEPRVLTHYAVLARCAGARVMADKYIQDPKADNHTMMARLVAGEGDGWEPTKKARDAAKIIYLGLCYGMGGAKLARSLGLPTKWITLRSGKYVEVAGDEAQSILDQFDRRAPFVRQLAKLCEEKAKRVGYVRTLSGRRCRFPKDESGNGFDWCHKALNRVIQGASADQTKTAMVAATESGFQLQLQVHDELDLSVMERTHAEDLASVMRDCIRLEVPSRVDVEVGPSWGEAK